jgi:hypothetical protein
MNYLVYRHIRLDTNEVFYIGIGSDKNRPFSKFSRNKYWRHITNLTEWKSQILFSNLSREDAESKEIEFIELYGRKDLFKGTLCNLTNGGTGGLGLKHTDLTKSKMKGRKAHNIGKSKYNTQKEIIINEYINSNYSHKYFSEKYNIPKSEIGRILLGAKKVRTNQK